jgi:hypothetical protein
MVFQFHVSNTQVVRVPITDKTIQEYKQAFQSHIFSISSSGCTLLLAKAAAFGLHKM